MMRSMRYHCPSGAPKRSRVRGRMVALGCLAGAVIATFTWFASPAYGAPRRDAKDPCANLVDSLASNAVTSTSAVWNSELVQSVLRWLAPKVNAEPSPQPAPLLYFTTSSGMALLETCEAGRGQGYEASMYYPIGLVVSAIRDETITRAGKPTLYKLVVAEHGLMIYLPASDLALIQADRAYVFADGPAIPYCVGSSDCVVAAAGDAGGRVLHATQRFAATSLDQAKDRRSCARMRIDPFNRGGGRTAEVGYLDPCQADGNGAAPIGSVKIVTRDWALEHFKRKVLGSFQRSSTDLVRRYIPNVLVVKDCNQEFVEEDKTTVSAGVRLGLPLGPVQAEMNTEGMQARNLIRRYGAQYFLRYSTYSGRLTSRGDYSVGDVAFTAKCKEDNPFAIDRPLSILFFGSEFLDHQLTFDAQEVVNSQYASAFATSGLQPVRETDALRHGKFWRIRGSDQYFNWRTAIRAYLMGNPALAELLEQMPPEEKVLTADLLTHLILAAGFDFKQGG